jgi:hypothetical protein
MIDKNEIIVIDDVFGPQVQDTLESWLLAGDSDWYFSKDIAFADDVVDRGNYKSKFGFSKTFFSVANSTKTPLFDTIFPLLLQSCDKINFLVEQVLFSRSFLTIPLPECTPGEMDNIHVDLIHPHLVSLYYVNDSDGDTVFFDQCLDDYLDRPDIAQALENIDYSSPGKGAIEVADSMIDKSNFTILKRVAPKKGRMVFFNGYRYHTSSRPSTGYRVIINNDIVGHLK